jgi:hypothetical protein
MNSELQLFQFSQNNSGGFFVVTDSVAHEVFVQAHSVDDANAKAKALGLFDLHFCECCGPRFHECFDSFKGDLLDLRDGEVSVVHRADGKVLRLKRDVDFVNTTHLDAK